MVYYYRGSTFQDPPFNYQSSYKDGSCSSNHQDLFLTWTPIMSEEIVEQFL